MLGALDEVETLSHKWLHMPTYVLRAQYVHRLKLPEIYRRK